LIIERLGKGKKGKKYKPCRGKGELFSQTPSSQPMIFTIRRFGKYQYSDSKRKKEKRRIHSSRRRGKKRGGKKPVSFIMLWG